MEVVLPSYAVVAPVTRPARHRGPISGMITDDNILAVSAQGIGAGDLAEVIRAIRAGLVYANVHTDRFSRGEIRGQLRAQ